MTRGRAKRPTFPRPQSVPSAHGVCCVRHPLCAPSSLMHHSLLHCFCLSDFKWSQHYSTASITYAIGLILILDYLPGVITITEKGSINNEHNKLEEVTWLRLQTLTFLAQMS